MASGKLSEIEPLDPVKDHQRIVHLMVCYEFPFDTTRSLEFALFRTYCVPTISGLLDRTGEFANCPQKRYDDTDILISEMMEWGYDSKRGTAALERIKSIHSHFDISNDDFLYVLSTFVFEPIRWNEKFGWRLMCDVEKRALFEFWRVVGQRMGIEEISKTFEAFEKFNRKYENKYFQFAPSNQRIGQATCDLFSSWFPSILRPIVRRVIYAMLDDSTRHAFGFPESSRLLKYFVRQALRWRGKLVSLMPKRRKPRLRTEMGHPSYPNDYQVDDIWPTYLNGSSKESKQS